MIIVRNDIITKITNNIPNKLRESFFIKNYNDKYLEIINYCINIKDLPFIQKIWHWVNNKNTYFTCDCGNKTSFNKNWKDGYRLSCSAKCSQIKLETKEKRKLTTIKKYGVTNIAKLDSIKEKQEKTNMEKYGFKSTFQNKGVQDKHKKTIKEKYDVYHYFQTDEFKIQAKKTNQDKYNKDWYTQTDEFKIQAKKTNQDKYNKDWYTQTNEYLEKAKKTNQSKYNKDWYTQTDEYKSKLLLHNKSKYGVDHLFQSDEFKNKIKGIHLAKYGVEHYSKSKQYKIYIESDKCKINREKQKVNFYKKRGFDYISYNNGLVTLLDSNCNHVFEIHPTNLQRRIFTNVCVCSICNPIGTGQSGQEQMLSKYITTIIDIETNKKTIIPPYELDIFIPSKNVAIEYNGLYWHSELQKDKFYHVNKLNLCQKKSIDIIQIWEDDWLHKPEIVKSIIKSRIGLIENKLYARKCLIRECHNKQEVNMFFDINHIQGKTRYKKAIGLYFNNILVSCMLFNQPKKEFELVRFCNLINYSVIGAASKLFSYYITNYKPNSITSFADRSMFTGDIYKSLGFKFVHRTPPNYWWIVDGIRRHRFAYNKKKLVKLGNDPLKTEIEIMHELGNFRIFGCGQDKWIWKK